MTTTGAHRLQHTTAVTYGRKFNPRSPQYSVTLDLRCCTCKMFTGRKWMPCEYEIQHDASRKNWRVTVMYGRVRLTGPWESEQKYPQMN